MRRADKPLRLALYEGEGNLWAGLLHGVLAIGFGLFVVALFAGPVEGGANYAPFGFVICGGGLWMILRAMRKANEPQAYFSADRNGFRIRGGRLRPWREFHGARVIDVRSEGSKVGEKIQIKLRPSGIFAHRTAAMLHYSQSGQRTVDRIIVFKHKLEDMWAEEAERFDLGSSPVVAARELADRKPAVMQPWSFRWRDTLRDLLGMRARR